MLPTSDVAPPPAGLRLIAIGASAGGVEALGIVLRALPATCRAAVVVVLHLAPGRSSQLPHLYAERCQLPLREAQDKEPLQGGTVYFAPPDYHLQVEPDGCFSLSQEAPVYFSRPSIDVLLETAAYAYRRAMLAIILTGASADGAAGLARVRQLGGSAWVQDPQRASYGIMPAAALKRAGADRVLDLPQMAASLALLDNGEDK
ncbi:chemotaxis protein CheB [Janthinobacterium lividum]|uniref:chemotaxis protein CheB n=1 Tax=Janthinobacterium lividum TaxID=29581 RepID=UPI0008738E67|nr:chemotaxis protein CheB [Janthinobacterium lividum]MCC7714268.1 chemotaxis protein CheB [Janthinobacterium lividum]OEZ46948.1 chemotaxis response regulator protein-glutamate methylesterase [Janthinobacterium lividum]WQE27806.1 chemotaxis protein CheB [Janthinobacterium lividum]STQ98724.1 Chemotaxis response regulator protein-glutamate methylesterase [Janthinobacterium lividum]